MTADHDRGDDVPTEGAELFRTSLPLIEHVIHSVCRKASLYGADAEDFASTVKVALIEDDYAILRAWRKQASLGGYLMVVVRRLLADERMRMLGRFNLSTEARLGGKAAELLETYVRRDGRPLEEVIPLIQAVDPALDRRAIEAMLDRLPQRVPRPRPAPLDDIDVESPRVSDGAEAAATEREVQRLSAQASEVVRAAMAALPQEDRTILRMHFGSSIGVAAISRMLRLPQRPLYRRIESSLARLRRALVAAGIDAGTAEDLIGSAVQALDFGLQRKTDAPLQSEGTGEPDA